MKLPELLSPAGDLERVQTALLYGADAVYFAGRLFGMRAKSVSFPDTDLQVSNPAPDQLASWIHSGEKDLCIVLPGENALITLNRDDTCMSVFNPPEPLLNRLRLLAAANGLFLWQPVSGQ